MATYVRASVTEAEKQSLVETYTKLGITESQLIRAGLKKMGVNILVKKSTGPITPKLSEDLCKSVKADYLGGASWKELQEKYNLNTRAVSNILGADKNKRARKTA